MNQQDHSARPPHPMDDFPVRGLRFDVSELPDEALVWSKSSPDFSMFINALGVHVPYFERFLVAVMRAYRDELDDAELKSDVQAIIGQEAHHAFNFAKLNQRLAKTYPGIGKLDAQAKVHFEKLLVERNKKFQIGHTAGYETFTFLAGAIVLDRYGELMADAHPELRSLWVWHQVEEVEHGAVAFDFYKAFYPDNEWHRRWMVFAAFMHIGKETALAFHQIVKVERPTLRGKLKAWSFAASFTWDLFRNALPVFSSNYHPRRHPICHGAQNQIAVAWRKYYAEGNDPTALTNEEMIKVAEYQQV